MEFSYTAISLEGIPIRLLAERWSYTNACCDDVLETIERPDLVFAGGQGIKVAARRMLGRRYLVVSYRVSGRLEGFVVSASIVLNVDERRALWRARGYS